MTEAWWLAVRGFCQVAPVAASTVFVSRGRFVHAGIAGFVISALWYSNVGTAAHLLGWQWAMMYAAGATAGTLSGMYLARRMSR